MTAEAGFIEVIIGVGILLAAAIIVGELFSRIKLPVVLGQLIAGMITVSYTHLTLPTTPYV